MFSRYNTLRHNNFIFSSMIGKHVWRTNRFYISTRQSSTSAIFSSNSTSSTSTSSNSQPVSKSAQLIRPQMIFDSHTLITELTAAGNNFSHESY